MNATTRPCLTSHGTPRYRHALERDADDAIRSMLIRGDRPGKDRLFAAVECADCHGWHVRNLHLWEFEPPEDVDEAREWEINGCPSGKQMHDTEGTARDQLISLHKIREGKVGWRMGRRGKPAPNGSSRKGEGMRSARAYEKAGYRLEVYKCDQCPGFHVGHSR